MAKRKKQRQREQQDQALSRKELARARVERRHRQRVMFASIALTSVVVIILGAMVVIEVIVKPGQPVAIVNGVELKTSEFQERVRLERAQFIDLILQYRELFGVEQVQGIAAQLDDHETLGQQVLDGMVDEVLVREAAAQEGIQVSEDEVWQVLEEGLGYYRDGTPTPRPTSTPRPSPTPITDTVPTPVPSRTPLPTPTAVTEDAFDELYDEQMQALRDANVDEDTYFDGVQFRLLTDKVSAWLTEDQPTVADQVEARALFFGTPEEANDYLARLEAGEAFDLLITEAQADPEDSIDSRQFAWAPLYSLVDQLGSLAAELAFALPVGGNSQVTTVADGRFAIIQVTGHEERELSASLLQQAEEQLYTAWLESLRDAATIETFDYWKDRIPTTPVLDIRELIPTPSPTPTEVTEE